MNSLRQRVRDGELLLGQLLLLFLDDLCQFDEQRLAGAQVIGNG